jgi:hypothetical protein
MKITEHPTRSEFSIGEVAERTGVSVDTLRYYEKAGLMPDVAHYDGAERGIDVGCSDEPVSTIRLIDQ